MATHVPTTGTIAELHAVSLLNETLPKYISFYYPTEDGESETLRHILATEATFALETTRIVSDKGEVFMVPGDLPITVIMQTAAQVIAEQAASTDVIEPKTPLTLVKDD